MAVPDRLLRSIEDFDIYPNNLLYDADPTEDFQLYNTQLRQANHLFLSGRSAHQTLVQFLDLPFSQNLRRIEKQVQSDTELKDWLQNGDNTNVAPSVPVQPAVQSPPVYQKDPKCRFIFIHAANSRSPLKLTREMLLRTFTYHQVMPGFIDFISVFGTQAESRGQRFCGFKTRSQLDDPAPNALIATEIERSGRYYQICYNLRSAGCSTNKVWSIRQAVFHHQFDVVHGTALWISAKGDQEMKNIITPAVKRMSQAQFQDASQRFASALEIHLLHSQWCTKGWLEYIESLEIELDKHDRRLGIIIWGQSPTELTPSDLQDVQDLEQKSNEALMTLDANINILSSLRGFYTNLRESNPDLLPPVTDWRKAIETFSKRFQNLESDILRFRTRAERLVRLATDKRSLVIKQLEFQSSKKMEKLTMSTHALGILAQREAVAVRIITIVSLIYLPCSVVSSVFSTDIIKFQNGNGSPKGQSYSWLALQRWLEVTLPLTFLTMTLGYAGYQFEKWRQQRDLDRASEKEMASQGSGP